MVRKLFLFAAFMVSVQALAAEFVISDSVQAELEKRKTEIAGWAAEAPIVSGVKDQNAKGPIAGMDNPKWKATKRSDPIVKELQSNAAASLLSEKVTASNGAFGEAFLSAAQGEKVAFVEKTSSYIHKGAPKFDVPFNENKAWQGKPEFDESTQTYAVQISVPVLDGGKPTGVLVVGVNLTYLEKIAGK
jgi:hypothetical protein